MTEAEAKKKWCPLARMANYSHAANRGVQGLTDGTTHCIASECMAWRQSYSSTTVWENGLQVYPPN